MERSGLAHARKSVNRYSLSTPEGIKEALIVPCSGIKSGKTWTGQLSSVWVCTQQERTEEHGEREMPSQQVLS